MKHREAVFVHAEGEGATPSVDGDFLDVPRDVVGERFERCLGFREIDLVEFGELAVTIRGHEGSLAVGGQERGAVGRGFVQRRDSRDGLLLYVAQMDT